MPFYSVLAGSGIIATLLKLRQVIFLLGLAVAFVIGFVKGFRRVSWLGLIWLTASLAFFAAKRIFSIEAGSGVMPMAKKLGLVMACVLAVMCGYAFLASLVRPKIRWVKDDVSGDTSLAEYGLEFEPEYIDYDNEDDWKPYGKRLQKTGFQPPSFFTRLVGGLTSTINAGMLMMAAMCLVVFSLEISGMDSDKLTDLLNNESLQSLINFTNSTMIDVIIIGVIFLLAKIGMGKSFMKSCDTIGFRFGSLLVCVGCLALPFTMLAKAEEGVFRHFAEFVAKCVQAGMKISSSSFGGILGQIMAGMILASVSFVGLFALHLAMKKLCGEMQKVKSIKLVDACVSTLVHALIGAVICIAIFAALACLEGAGIFEIGSVFGENAILSRTLFDTVFQEVKNILGSKLG